MTKHVSVIGFYLNRNPKERILDVIRAVAERNNARLSLPIMGAKYFRLVFDRRKFQDKEYMEKFVTEMGFTTFDEMKEFKKAQESKYSKIATERTDIKQRMTYLENLLSVYEKYEPYIQYHKEQWALKGFERKKYERKHIAELSYYDAYREHLKEMIVEPDKKITAGAWKKELATLEAKYEKGKQPYAEVVTDLACVEVYNITKRTLIEFCKMKETHEKDKPPKDAMNRVFNHIMERSNLWTDNRILMQ